MKKSGQPFFRPAAAAPPQKKTTGGNTGNIFFRPGRLFTVLAVLLTFAFVFQLCTVVSFRASTAEAAGAKKPAPDSDDATDAADEQPPPLTQDDINKTVKETARKSEDAAAPAAAAPAGQPAADVRKSGAASDPDANPPPGALAPSFSTSEIEVLQSLSKRRDDLDRREKRVAEHEALLSAAEQEVDHKIAELNKLKGEIENLLGQQQKMENDRLQSLVKIYEGMKPKEAAAIFNTLDMDVLLPVISHMNERKSGPILASMSPDKARIVTIRLAQQRDLPAAVPPRRAEPGPPPLPPPP